MGHEHLLFFCKGDKILCRYIEKRDFQISLLRVYSINSMDSQSFYICRMQCNWIQSLKRHSILISESGEMQRMDFLQKQQAIIDSL